MSKIRVYESNSGVLCMTDNKTVVTGFEHREKPGGMLNDLLTWEEWKGDASDVYEYNPDENMGNLIAELTLGDTVVEVYLKHMGKAGFRYAGIV